MSISRLLITMVRPQATLARQQLQVPEPRPTTSSPRSVRWVGPEPTRFVASSAVAGAEVGAVLGAVLAAQLMPKLAPALGKQLVELGDRMVAYSEERQLPDPIVAIFKTTGKILGGLGGALIAAENPALVPAFTLLGAEAGAYIGEVVGVAYVNFVNSPPSPPDPGVPQSPPDPGVPQSPPDMGPPGLTPPDNPPSDSSDAGGGDSNSEGDPEEHPRDVQELPEAPSDR